MDVTVIGRGVEIPDRFEDYVTEKSEKIAHLAERSLALDIRVSRHHEKRGQAGDDRVELTLVGPGPVVRAEAGAGDKYAAFDLAFDKLVERIRQAKDRRKVHRGKRTPASLSDASAAGFPDLDVTPASAEVIERVATGSIPVIDADESERGESPVVIRRKVFPMERMTPESAVDRMELVGHDFFLFIDAESDRPSVVYRRQGWDYGVIGLEDEEAASERRLATGGRSRRVAVR
ncbi:MAG: ribosome-associated translation inhibitor RaiA [Actinomycetales bacterium]|nr:ribosome-associated translation inhibitor RaiA [Actinomycetales bacterium]